MIGVVVPVYVTDRSGLTTAVEALRAYGLDLPAYARIVVVNNGCPLPTAPRALAPLADDYVELPLNLGYARAVNLGLDVAAARGADHYVVGSADVIVPRASWLQPLMGDGIRSAIEAGFEHDCEHDGRCPFWGGLFAFPQSVTWNGARLPTRFRRCADAAFALACASAGVSVERADIVVEHRHTPTAGNAAADPAGLDFEREVEALRALYGDPCTYLLERSS